jgi:hypothetical protein
VILGVAELAKSFGAAAELGFFIRVRWRKPLVGRWEDSAMTGDRGEGDFVVGDVDPMDRTQGAESDQPTS